MGWREGQGLGKLGDGIAEPIQATSNNARTGLGYPTSSSGTGRNVGASGAANYAQLVQQSARERFDNITKDDV